MKILKELQNLDFLNENLRQALLTCGWTEASCNLVNTFVSPPRDSTHDKEEWNEMRLIVEYV